jgi:hypothetical protein
VGVKRRQRLEPPVSLVRVSFGPITDTIAELQKQLAYLRGISFRRSLEPLEIDEVGSVLDKVEGLRSQLAEFGNGLPDGASIRSRLDDVSRSLRQIESAANELLDPRPAIPH